VPLSPLSLCLNLDCVRPKQGHSKPNFACHHHLGWHLSCLALVFVLTLLALTSFFSSSPSLGVELTPPLNSPRTPQHPYSMLSWCTGCPHRAQACHGAHQPATSQQQQQKASQFMTLHLLGGACPHRPPFPSHSPFQLQQ